VPKRGGSKGVQNVLRIREEDEGNPPNPLRTGGAFWESREEHRSYQ